MGTIIHPAAVEPGRKESLFAFQQVIVGPPFHIRFPSRGFMNQNRAQDGL